MRLGTPHHRRFRKTPSSLHSTREPCPFHRCAVSLLLVLVPFLLTQPILAEDKKVELSPDRQLALDRYDAAWGLRTNLESKPPRLRTVSEYSRVIEKFRSVYSASPASSKSDDALFAVGELYQMMGSDLKNPQYFQKAIKAYGFLIREYPGSPYCPSAAFGSAEIYYEDLKDSKSADQAFQDFLKRYPSSKRARNARARLEDIRAQSKQARNKTRNEENELPLGSAETEVRVAQSKIREEILEKEPARPVSRSAAQTGNDTSSPPSPSTTVALPVSVKDLRFWEADGYFRIVVVLDKKTSFLEDHLDKPNRIIVDIENAVLPGRLLGQGFTPGGNLERIRLGQPKKEIARLVFVGDAIKDHTVFTLDDPFRIVVDIRQEPPSKREEAGQPAAGGRAMKTLGTPLTDELKIASKFRPTPRRSQHEKPTEKVLVQEKIPVTPPDSGDAAVPTAAKKARSESVAPSPDTASKVLKPPAGGRKSGEVAASSVPLPKSDGTRSLIRMLGLKIGRIVIDPGHGGHDTGTIGPSGLMEKDLVLDVALKLKDLIEERLGGDVVLTRTDDTFIPLERRTEIANENQADLFVSIHANSSRDHTVRGIETFYLDFTSSPESEEIASRENATSEKTIFELQDLVRKIALKEKIDESREFALIIQKSILKQVQKAAPRSGNRGVKQAPFIVLIGAHMPSILAELSFLSNPADEKLLRTFSYRQKIAQALCSGIENYTRNLGGIRTARKLP
jgi:N-acetylmuramoyl-L-alanine amidase